MNCSMGDGCGPSGGDNTSAWRNCRNSAPVRVGKKGVEWPIMSVCLRFPNWKRMAIPRGSALASKSGMLGIPVELENRTQIGVDLLLKWGAVDSFLASSEGVKVPVRISPLA